MPVKMVTTFRRNPQNRIIDDTSDDEQTGLAQRGAAQKSTPAPTKPPKKAAPVKGVTVKSDTQKSKSEGGWGGKGGQGTGGVLAINKKRKMEGHKSGRYQQNRFKYNVNSDQERDQSVNFSEDSRRIRRGA